MAFGFAAPDYLTRAQAGMPLDPNAPDQSPVPAAPIAAPPQADLTAQLPQPGMLDILQNMLFKGESPADAAMAVRQRDYQVRTMQRTAAILPTLPAPLQAAAMMGGPKVWEEIAKNYGPQTRSAGQQTDYMGGANHGGYTASTDTYGVDAPSGKPDVVGAGVPGGFRTLGPSLGGGFSVSPTGAVLSDRMGLTGQTVSLPEIIAPGSEGRPFTPVLSGVGGASTPPATPISATPHPSSIVNAQGALDPAAFFRSFVLPHEGGLNPRDLNGSPTKYGINAASNPDIDLNKLTPEGAATVFATKYFPASGAAQLPPALAAVHADTSFINPAKAQDFLKASGGDPNKYMDLRDAWMGGIVQKYPAAQKYAQAWSNRNADLRSVAASLDGTQSSGSSTTGSGAAAGFGSPFAQGAKPQPMSPAQRTQWGVPPSDSRPWMMGADGKPAPVTDAQYGPKDVREQRAGFFNSDEYKEYNNAATAANNLERLLHSFTGNNSVLDQAALDNGIRTMTGLSARNQNVVNFTDHLGLPDKLVGSITQKFGNGYLTPDVVMGIRTMIRGYADGHLPAAQQRLANETAFAKANGQDFGGSLTPVLPQQDVPWLDGRGQRQGGATLPSGMSHDQALAQARAVIAKGADRTKVVERLQKMGVDPRGL